jgi:hypothetical protein
MQAAFPSNVAPRPSNDAVTHNKGKRFFKAEAYTGERTVCRGDIVGAMNKYVLE